MMEKSPNYLSETVGCQVILYSSEYSTISETIHSLSTQPRQKKEPFLEDLGQ